jgi:hypothetical protein
MKPAGFIPPFIDRGEENLTCRAKRYGFALFDTSQILPCRDSTGPAEAARGRFHSRSGGTHAGGHFPAALRNNEITMT